MLESFAARTRRPPQTRCFERRPYTDSSQTITMCIGKRTPTGLTWTSEGMPLPPIWILKLQINFLQIPTIANMQNENAAALSSNDLAPKTFASNLNSKAADRLATIWSAALDSKDHKGLRLYTKGALKTMPSLVRAYNYMRYRMYIYTCVYI